MKVAEKGEPEILSILRKAKGGAPVVGLCRGPGFVAEIALRSISGIL